MNGIEIECPCEILPKGDFKIKISIRSRIVRCPLCQGSGWSPVERLPREIAKAKEEIERRREALERNARVDLARGRDKTVRFSRDNGKTFSTVPGVTLDLDSLKVPPLDESVARRLADRLQNEMEEKITRAFGVPHWHFTARDFKHGSPEEKQRAADELNSQK